MAATIERRLTLVGDEPMEHFYHVIPGFFHFQECYERLLRVLPTDQPSTFVEIGSFAGKSLSWLAVEAINRHIPVTIHAVDSFEAWEGVPQGTDLRALFDEFTKPVADHIRVWPMRSLDAVKHFADESLDVVFVDGAHDYDSVTADINAWFPKLKPGAFMAGDDFLMAPVCKAVCEQFAPSGYILCHGWTTIPVEQCWPSWIARKA